MKKTILFAFFALFFCLSGVSLFAQNNALFKAAEKGTSADVQNAVKKGADVNARDSYGNERTALMVASSNDALDVIKELIALNADVNAQDIYGKTALMYAAEFSTNTEIIKTLIKANADVNAKDSDGMTALMLALSEDNINADTVRLLVASGADVKTQNKYMKRAIDYLEKNKKLRGTNVYLELRELLR